MEDMLNVAEAKTRLIQELSEITGFKYLKSGVLKKTVKDIVFEINFFSSKWNESGQSIEINAELRLIYKILVYQFRQRIPAKLNNPAFIFFHFNHLVTVHFRLHVFLMLLKNPLIDLSSRHIQCRQYVNLPMPEYDSYIPFYV